MAQCQLDPGDSRQSGSGAWRLTWGQRSRSTRIGAGPAQESVPRRDGRRSLRCDGCDWRGGFEDRDAWDWGDDSDSDTHDDSEVAPIDSAALDPSQAAPGETLAARRLLDGDIHASEVASVRPILDPPRIGLAQRSRRSPCSRIVSMPSRSSSASRWTCSSTGTPSSRCSSSLLIAWVDEKR